MRLSFTDPASAAAVVAHLRTEGHAPTTEVVPPSLFGRLLGGKALTHVDFPDAAVTSLLQIADAVGLTPERLCGPGARARFEAALVAEGKRVYEKRGGYLDLRGRDDVSLMLEEERAWLSLVGTPAAEQEAWWRDLVAGRAVLRGSDPDVIGAAPTDEQLEDATLLRAGFVTSAKLEATLEGMPPGARPLAKFILNPTPVPGLFITPFLDTGKTLHLLMMQHLDALELTPEQALQRAIENVGDEPVPPGKLEQVTPDVMLATFAATDGYAAVRLLFNDFREGVEKALGGPAVYAIPSRDLLLAARADSLPARVTLALASKSAWQGAPWPLVPQLLRVGPNGLTALTEAEVLAPA